MLKRLEQEPSATETPFLKSDKLPQFLTGISIPAIILSGVSERYTFVPIGTLALTIASLVYVARNENN